MRRVNVGGNNENCSAGSFHTYVRHYDRLAQIQAARGSGHGSYLSDPWNSSVLTDPPDHQLERLDDDLGHHGHSGVFYRLQHARVPRR